MTTRNVVTRVRRSARPISKEFQFTQEMIPALSDGRDFPQFLRDYRQQAWDSYQNLQMPTTTDEPWRRTDIRSLRAAAFKLPEEGAYNTLSGVPSQYLRPIVGERHGGQIVLQPGLPAQIELDSALAAQGVIFTDLTTAEKNTLKSWK